MASINSPVILKRSLQTTLSLQEGDTALLGGLAAGHYQATYTLNFTDDTAVGIGQMTNALTLNLSGTVAAVPEPGTWAMMLLGFGLMGWRARRT